MENFIDIDSLENPLENVFDYNNSPFIELFDATDDNVDLRTENISFSEVLIISKLQIDNEFIKSRLNFDLFSSFINHHQRNKISLLRKSRSEFVDINRGERFEQDLKKFGDFSNIMDAKK